MERRLKLEAEKREKTLEKLELDKAKVVRKRQNLRDEQARLNEANRLKQEQVDQYNYESAIKTAAEAERIAAQDLADKKRIAQETAQYHAQLRQQGLEKQNAIALAAALRDEAKEAHDRKMFEKQIEDAKALRRKQQNLHEEKARLNEANRLKQDQVERYHEEAEARKAAEKARIMNADMENKERIAADNAYYREELRRAGQVKDESIRAAAAVR